MIFFPGLDVEKSKRRRWLIYKKSPGSHLERLFLFFLLGSQFLCTLLLYGSLDPDNPNDVFAEWLIPLWILLILYVTCMAVFETFLKKKNTTFGKEENKALLQQLAVQRNWKSVRRSGDCLIYIMSDEEFSYRSLSIMIPGRRSLCSVHADQKALPAGCTLSL
ncbi:hypothetical protein [Taibaiella helva]|uniref:hypothetical protein n=1 Tax=Taibaiella helva TaxID=2301235 RepID=UPI000E56771E|nr:hypothetical protein [Taibaiella helva]